MSLRQTDESTTRVMLLESKTQPPVPAHQLISRSGLAARTSARVTLIVAPPGFGKTCLAVQWLREAPFPSAWLSLDAQDNDLTRFVFCTASVLQRIHPAIGQDALDALRSDQMLAPQTLATLLLNSLIGLNESLMLVLDDYHIIESAAVQQFVIFLVEHAPPCLHLLLTTRHDPAFPARWRARGWMQDIRADQLRFTGDEAHHYLNTQAALNLPNDLVEVLLQRTEGWAAGLQLAALALRSAPDTRLFVQQFSGSQQFVIDYLLEEVLEQQPEEVQQFLRQTAVLDRMHAPLCDAVTGRSDSAAILSRLQRANLFVVPLEAGWFRYHHLFADVLRLSLPVAEQQALCQRAAAWHAAHGLTEEAVMYYLQAGTPEPAAACVAQLVLPALMSGDHMRLKHLLTLLPEASIHQQPALLMAQSWFAAHAHQLETASQLLDSIPATATDPLLRAWMEAIRALVAYFGGEMAAILPHIEVARTHSTAPKLLGTYNWLSGMAYWENGQSQMAIDSIRTALRAPSVAGDPFACSGVSFFLTEYLNQMGRRQEALTVCERLMTQLVDGDDNPLAYAAPLIGQTGILHYEANELELAEYHLKRSLRLFEPMALTQGLVVARVYLALIAYARGDQEHAYRTLYDARYAATSAGSQPFSLLVDAVEHWLYLRDGDTQRVARWLAGVPVGHPRLPFAVNLIAARGVCVLAADQAPAVLDTLETEARRCGHDRRLIPILILRALLHDQHAHHAGTFACLREAIQLAAGGGYIRDFLDESPRLLTMLPRIREAAPSLIDQLTQTAPPPAAIDQPLVEPLTERELEVLQLASEGYSNREIAARLFVAVSTVKSHIKHAFGKLDADSRTRAIARAHQLGLLQRP